MKKIVKILLLIVLGFLAVSALPSGFLLMAGVIPVPMYLLEGTPFTSWVVPGLVLSLVVGGSTAVAFVLLLRGHKFGLLGAVTTGTIIMFFEFVEVIMIGTDNGPAGFLQKLYFGIGTVIVVLACLHWFMDLQTE